jgi:hypothetical protein
MKEFVLAGIFIIIVGFFLLFMYREKTEVITNFQECIEAGYPVLETDPPRCTVPGGETFILEAGE